jgi:hypothetical protein
MQSCEDFISAVSWSFEADTIASATVCMASYSNSVVSTLVSVTRADVGAVGHYIC